MIKFLYDYLIIKTSGLFDRNHYLLNNPDVRKAGTNPIAHYIREGWREGRDPGPFFNTSWYLNTYDDVRASKVNPLVHYIRHGMEEGRLPRKNYSSKETRPNRIVNIVKKFRFKFFKGQKPEYLDGEINFIPEKETVLIVSHDSSLTGAPILSLNIAQNMKREFNVISLLLNNGPLVESFCESSVLVIYPQSSEIQSNVLQITEIINKLLQKYEIKFAIVNSIVSREVLPILAERFVPSIHLIHEFAAYVRPKTAFPFAALWSHQTIYSTSMTYENALSNLPELNNSPVLILPQGKSEIPDLENNQNLSTVEVQEIDITKIKGQNNDTFLVLGIGSVQIRKGLDLFIACASKVTKAIEGKTVKFLWIGDGYRPETDMSYSAYIAEQIHRSGLEESVIIRDNAKNLDAIYDNADILLLSSRLDPLPNVAIDAMTHRLPVLCFNKATGIADLLIENDLGDICVSPYMDIHDISEKTVALLNGNSLRIKVGERLHNIAAEKFSMENYINNLVKVGDKIHRKVKEEKRDIEEIAASGIDRMDFYIPPNENYPHPFIHYVRSWASGIYRRKLFPGFHPGIYLDFRINDESNEDPLANYLRNERPEGPWTHELITGTSRKP